MKNPWMWAWLVAAGLIVGFIFGRAWNEPEVAPTAAVPTADEATAIAPDMPAVSPSRAVASPSPRASASTPLEASTPSVPGGGQSGRPISGSATAYLPSVDSGVVNAVDAGEVFNKQIARPSTPDHPNQLGDAHREFEREARDDSWAYTMEAELQNSMVNATSTGQFRMEHLECRTTICEVRISGNGDQADAVRNWSNALPSETFNQQLFMNVSSTISSHERIDAIYIFRRPAKIP